MQAWTMESISFSICAKRVSASVRNLDEKAIGWLSCSNTAPGITEYFYRLCWIIKLE